MTGTATGPASVLAERIEAVERAYEYMLAYAAQGRRSENEGGMSSNVRELLEKAENAADGLASMSLAELSAAGSKAHAGFLDVLKADAGRARAMFALVLIQPAISSQLVDNLNASTHVRALLTDLFVLGETLKH